MRTKRRWPVSFGMVLMLALAGCNFTQQMEPVPETPREQPTFTPLVIPTTPGMTVGPPTIALTPLGTTSVSLTPSATATRMLLPTQENLGILPSLTPTLTQTPLPTAPPTATPLILPTRTPLPSLTPSIAAPTSPPATATPRAAVCPSCGGLRLRDRPGTGGDIITMLESNTPLNVIGRTSDNNWVQVITPDGTIGWVSAEYVIFNVDVNLFNVSGAVVNVSPTPAPTAVAQVPQHLGAADVAGIVTGITARSRQILLDGLAKGNLPNVFTRVGDSITVAGQFLTQIGNGNYNLGEYSRYAPVIQYFSGPNGRGYNPFDSPLLAAGNGWSTLDVLDPGHADAALCRPGETPLRCEYRLVRPAVALIMLGTNDAGGVATETYAANMRRIVEISIEMGVIPVLSTLPPKPVDVFNAARVDEFNRVIVGVARAYDIPLWNYWQALQSLPNRGISDDGVHPSTPPDNLNCHFDAEHLNYGFPVRNLTALQVLDQLWRQVLYDGGSVVASTGSNRPTSTPLPEPTLSSGSSTQGAYQCPGAPPPRLTVGQTGRVTPGLPNKLRSEPSLNASEVGRAPGEAVFVVVGGPVCADGYTWWQINYNGIIGWTASGTEGEYWVEPYGG